MNYRDTASFGKRQEYIAVAELLKREFDVYMTLVDDQGIDCVLRLNENRYLDIQIRARSTSASRPNYFVFDFKPRANLWFIFFTEKTQQYWTIPSRDVYKLGTQNKTGKHVGQTGLPLPSPRSKKRYQLFEKYLDDAGFEAMRQ